MSKIDLAEFQRIAAPKPVVEISVAKIDNAYELKAMPQ